MRESCGQPLVEVVHTQDIPVEQFPLAVRRQGGGERLRDAAVHVPLDVRDLRLRENFCHHAIDMVHHLRAGEVQHVLVPSGGGPASRRLDDPIRVGAVEVRVLVRHFRLKPQAEPQAQPLHPLCQPGDAAGETVWIGCPVPQARAFVGPCAEPAVVQNKQLHAVLPGRLSNGHQLILGEIKIGGLPVVEQDGPGTVPPVPAGQTGTVELVESAAHGPHALAGVDHHRLRRLELPAGGQLPVKAEGVDAHCHPRGIPVVHLHLGQKVPGVDQGEAHDLALVLVCAGTAQHNKRIVVVGGVAPCGFHRLDALLQLPDLHEPLTGPGAGEMDELIPAVRQVQAQAHSRSEMQVLPAPVFQTGGAGQRGLSGKDGVVEVQLDLQQRVPQADRESLRLPVRLAVRGGQTRQGGLSRRDGVGVVDKVCNPAAVGLAQLHRRVAEVCGAIDRVLLLAVFQGEIAVPLKHAGAHGPGAQLQQVVKALPVPDRLAAVQLAQRAVGQYLHQITDLSVGQMEGLGRFVVKNAHAESSCI